METNKIPARADVPEKDKWAIQDLFATDDDWRAALAKAKEFIPRITAFRGRLAESGAALLSFFRLDDEISLAFDALVHYAQRRSDEDTRVAAYQEMVSQVTRFAVEIQSAAAFETPELLAISDEDMNHLYAEAPELELYRLNIDRIRRREHVLSDKEEAILAAAGEMAASPDDIYSMLNDADLKFPDAVDKDGNKHPVTHGTFIPLMQSYDRVLRKSAFDSLYSVYGQFRNTSAATLSAQLKQLLFFANVRKYPSTLDAALDGNEVPTGIYRNLIDAVHRSFAPMYRYVALRKKLLGVDELHMYDLYVPVVDGVEMKFTFEEAKEIALKALAPLGEDYLNLLREGFANGWIDVYENEGKRSGAYSAGARVHPYVLLNFKGTLDDVFTLVHEMGHSIHSYLSNKTQPTAYQDYVIFVAEVASTCNEALLMEYLLSVTTDKKERAYLINHFLEQFRGTLYRQTMFAEFELTANEMTQRGEGTTAEALCAMYKKLNEQYFGPEMNVDEEISLEWARIPHFYYDYYVYQYATGYAAAIALSRRILREGEPAVKDYLGFLSGGCSADPITLLRGAGVDMASPKPIEDATKLFDEMISEMEKILN
ncbi:oligoendopeptidase F [Butyricicoccus faecihominis]|uniref:Oligopeptidase F n=1 Tax=Butyricicoccus faecihominis TaxID=1712515 RepID=A0ABQ1DW07_9FIRM|nr:oligoendopeptidase F [Butyricicoccus faecihominis]GFO86926.1 oligoendopeptidase F [Butyricicoccus faecihominis]GGM71077.1 oligoendopeptidase F [Butyricicoccus faecihominis]